MHDGELCASVWRIYGDGTAIHGARKLQKFPLSPKRDDALQRVSQNSLFAGGCRPADL